MKFPKLTLAALVLLCTSLSAQQPAPPQSNNTDATKPVEVAPVDKNAAQIHIPVDENVMSQRIRSVGSIQYPPEALEKHIEGTVFLKGVIDEHGYVIDLKVISGPEIFRQSAVDAVHSWVYRPYKLNGKPVQVETTIRVIFKLK